MRWPAIVGVLAIACGSGARGRVAAGGRLVGRRVAGDAPAVARPGVEELAREVTLASAPGGEPVPREPRAYVATRGYELRITLPGQPAIDVTEDTKLDELVRDVHAKLPASPACPRPARPTDRVTHITARREVPAATDAVLLIDHRKPATGLVGVMALLAYPTAIAVENPGGAIQVLPFRFCAAYDEPPKRVANALEVVNGGKLVIVPSGGIRPRTATLHDVDVSTVEQLATTMRELADGQTLALARFHLHAAVPVSRLVRELVATDSVGVPAIDIGVRIYNAELLEAKFDRIRATGGAELGRTRSAILRTTEHLQICYQFAAFSDPALAGRFAVASVVNVDGTLAVSRAPDANAAFAACFAELIARIRIPRVSAVGAVEFDVVLERKPDP